MEQFHSSSEVTPIHPSVSAEEIIPAGVPSPSPHPQPAAPPRRLGLSGWLFWSFAFVLTTAVSATVGATVALLAPLPPAVLPQHKKDNSPLAALWRSGFQYKISRPVNILVMGIDRVLEVPDNSPDIFSGNSDTMLLVQVDPTEEAVNLLSIPRDTRVEIPNVGVEKINYANAAGGAPMAARVVSRTLNNIPVDRYVRVSTDAFRELVDLLGGVDVFVPYPMSYVDNTQNLKIDLLQGWQTLNGDQAEQFVRFRNDEHGDIGRVQRQQTVLKSLRDRLTHPTVIPRLPQIIHVMTKYIDTNLSLEELAALASFGLNLEAENLRMVMLPGRFSAPDEYIASYWLMDSEGRDRVMREYFNVGSATLAFDRNSTGLSRESPSKLRIAIQNASGEPDLGERLAIYLEKKGFYNTYVVQDWPDHQRQTQIIVQQGNFPGATAVKRLLGVGKIEATSTGDIESDLTIRIGEDWVKRL